MMDNPVAYFLLGMFTSYIAGIFVSLINKYTEKALFYWMLRKRRKGNSDNEM